jgi:hypothetical protein
MPKIVWVKLLTISCDANGFGGAVQLSGNTFASTFHNNPNNASEESDIRSIFPFPNGPIALSQGQSHSVTMEPVAFALGIGPPHEPAGLAPKFLKFGGALNNGLGSNATVIPSSEPLPFVDDSLQGAPRPFPLVYETANLKVTLTFGLIVRQVF